MYVAPIFLGHYLYGNIIFGVSIVMSLLYLGAQASTAGTVLKVFGVRAPEWRVCI